MKKVLSIVLLLTLVLSSVCVASAETDVLANTFWKISFAGQSTYVHFYENNKVLVTNGQMNGNYTYENGKLSINGSSLGLSGTATVNKALSYLKLTKTVLRYNTHNINLAGTFTFSRVKPSVKKATYTKVKRDATTTLKMTFGDASEYYIITDRKTGEEYGCGPVVDGAAVFEYAFANKTNSLYIKTYLCDKSGSPVMSSEVKKAATVYCK